VLVFGCVAVSITEKCNSTMKQEYVSLINDSSGAANTTSMTEGTVARGAAQKLVQRYIAGT
jgi:hypothetical protein